MKPVFVYPASFCPPTFGHFHTVKKAAVIVDHLILICSINPKKTGQIFTPKECVGLWHSYPLPANVEVMTLAEFVERKIDPKRIVMVRGIRDKIDSDYEQQVMFFNYQNMGIDKYFYLISDDVHKEISSSKVRQLAKEMQLEKLGEYVSPLVLSKLLEKNKKREV